MKIVVWITAALMILIAGAWYKTKEDAASEKTVSKCVSIAVYKGINYNSKIYNNASAAIEITIEKVNDKSRVAVWRNSSDAKQLRKYPSLENAAYQSVIIPCVIEKKEHLEITYTILYNSKGSELQMQNRMTVVDCCNKNKLGISI